MFTFRLLGDASLEGPSGPVDGRAVQPARLALLALLTVPHCRSVSRDKLVALLWPERATSRGRRALSDGLYALRQTLGDDALRSLGDSLLLDSDRVVTDVRQFRQALGRGAPLEAVEAYGGPLLDGVHLRDSVAFERWVDRERERLASQFRRVREAGREPPRTDYITFVRDAAAPPGTNSASRGGRRHRCRWR